MKAFTEFANEQIEHSIPDRFEKMVKEYPNRLAVKVGNRALTYDALNQLVNRIARAILTKGRAGSEPIALLFEHGVDVIAAIFATLRAGKFYVALDPSFPAERMTSIWQDSQAGLIVTNDHSIDLAHKLTNDTRALLNIDEIHAATSFDNDFRPAFSNGLVNIRYTSGSTGEPKGIVQGHQQALYHVTVGAAERRIGADDRLTLLHSVALGSATTHIFQSLLNGASLFPFDVKSEGIPRLTRWLQEEEITVCDLPPSLFRQLAASLQGVVPPSSLRLLTLVGAPITQVDFNLYKKNFGRGTLVEIALGSTEAGMICSAIVDQNFSFPKEGAPVGYPCRGKKILLLDENGHEVGPGEVGEIAVKSRYLALGYWRRPELTSAKFLPDPDGGDERIYLTGDLGRKLLDGFLVHVGRKDFQVKIRGYRVETGEIEATLLEHAAIKEAIVVAQDDLHQEKRLVAYVVSCQEPAPTTHELRMFLHKKVPDYMVPSVFVPLNALPLTPNGKVDRQALPAPKRMRPDQNETFAAPRNPTEERLAGIWATLLGLEHVGIHDNFFDLGGNSLFAIRLFAEIEKEFKKRLPLSCLFEDGTIQRLARIINQPIQASLWPSLVTIQPHGTKRPFFCVHELFGDVFCYRMLAHYLGQDQPFYALQPEALNGLEKSSADIKAMAAHYIQEIRTLQPRGPYGLGGYSSGGVVAFEMARQLRANGEAVAIVAIFDSTAVTSGQNKFSRIWSFLCNLPADLASWLIGFLQLTPRQCLDLIRFKIGMIKTRVIATFCAPGSCREVVTAKTVKEMADLFQFSEKQQEIALAQCRGLLAYKPGVYPDRLTLFRTQTTPLFYSHGTDKGWGKLAAGGVEIRVVPGHHLTMLREPHVKILAEELRVCLDKAQEKIVSGKADRSVCLP
jgi:amino acid adenylation domain-containing protein